MASLKGVYNWILQWAESKWGMLALFIMAFAEASFFPIPPDVLLIACCLAAPSKAFRFALVCTAGSVAGAVAGYLLGEFVWIDSAGEFTGFANFFFRHVFSIEQYYTVKGLYDQYNFWVIFTAGFTPLPYKLFTITAGVFQINFPMFILASVVSRGMRFFLIAGLIWKFGAPIKTFIDKYFNWLALAFTVLLIGSFVLVKYLL